MAPPKLSPRKLGTVVANKSRFRAQVMLNRIVEAGPLRAREADADADLALVRECPARGDIPGLLASLRAEAAVSDARRVATSPAVLHRKRAVDGTSRPAFPALRRLLRTEPWRI